MKKLLSVVLSALMVLTLTTASFCAVKVQTPPNKEDSITLNEKETYGLTLDENRSTGYSWKYEISDSSIIKVTNDSYAEPIDGRLGSSGSHKYEIQAVKSGTAAITFSLVKAGTSAPAETYSIYVEVKASANPTTNNVNYTAGKTYEIKLEENVSTGYTWKYSISDKNIVKVASSSFEEPINGVVGTPGERTFKLQALKAGDAVVTFSLTRGTEKATKVIKYNVHVVGSSSGSEIKFTTSVGKSFSISVKSNGTTGYIWSSAISNSKVVKLVKEATIAPTSDLAGAGGKQTFTFKALKKGTTKITLVNKRSWEKDAFDTKTYLITVK